VKHLLVTMPQGFGLGLQGLGSAGGYPSSSGRGGGPASSQQQHQQQHQQSPAIESLTLTAQSVGLSIEQLAAALSSSPNLKAITTDGNITDGQKELALSLYRTESLALHRRCMLLAGFDPTAIEETSPEYLQFAFKAWQEEGTKLQDLLGMEMSLAAPAFVNFGRQQQQQEVAQAQAQLQAQVQAQAVQNQAKALALEQRQRQQQFLLHNHLSEQQNSELKSLLYSQQQQQQLQLQRASSASGTNNTMTASPPPTTSIDASQNRLTGMQLLSSTKGPFY